jgi:hypothetical protein
MAFGRRQAFSFAPLFERRFPAQRASERFWYVALIVIATAFASNAHAVNYNFLKDAPVTRLNSAELKEFLAFVSTTLDQTADGDTVEWTASKTRFNSKLTPKARSSDNGKTCREIRIESDSVDRHARGDYRFCKNAQGIWQVANPKTPPK